MALPSHQLPGDLSNQKYAPVPPCSKLIRGSPLDKFELGSASFTACHRDLGSVNRPLPPALKFLSSKLLRILRAHSAIFHLFAAAVLAEMPGSAYLTCNAELRCFTTHPTFTSQIKLVYTLSLHLSHGIFMIFFSSLSPAGELFKGGVVSCVSMSLAWAQSQGLGGCLSSTHPLALFPSPAASPRAFCRMEMPTELRQWGCPEAHHQR